MVTYEETEDDKYSWLYENGYGTGPVKKTLDWCASVAGEDWPPNKVLDLGCGRASLIGHGWKSYTGIDIASSVIKENRRNFPKSHFVHGSISETPFDDHEFDAVFCIDVLEHLPEQIAHESIVEALRVATMGFFSISTRPSYYKSREGEQLHLTVQPAQWWLRLFEKYGSEVAASRVEKHSVLIWVRHTPLEFEVI